MEIISFMAAISTIALLVLELYRECRKSNR